MDETQERDVANGLRQGSADAWRALYDAYSRRVWSSIARLMGPHSADVGDVVQDTFLAAAGAARLYDPRRGSLWLWLSGIARNHVALYYRRRRRHDRSAGDVGLSDENGLRVVDWLDGREASPGDVLASAELAATVRNALTELPADYETLLTAKYCDGVTLGELAQSHSSSVEAIRSKLARARRAFRRAFAKHAPCPDDGCARGGDEQS